MKYLLMITALMFAGLASAKEIRCESAADASVYMSTGKIQVRATLEGPFILRDFSMRISGSGNVGVSADRMDGAIGGSFIRFQEADGWCDYTFVVPQGYTRRDRVVGFLDAKCDAGINSRNRLSCTIR